MSDASRIHGDGKTESEPVEPEPKQGDGEEPVAKTDDSKPDPKQNAPPEDEELGDKGLAALRRERQARKEAEKSASGYKTSMEELAARVEELEAVRKQEAAEREAAERKSLQLEVATSLRLPANIASRIQGSTREEMESDAKELIESLNIDTRRFKVKDASQGRSAENHSGSVSSGRELYRSRRTKK